MTPPPPTFSFLDKEGREIGPVVEAAAREAGIPVELLLACGWAESGWDRMAQHWGWRTQAAEALINTQDWDGLRSLIDAVWPDVSFGYGQRVLAWHYVGDGSPDIANCLYVRQYVREHPEEDIRQMAAKLADCWEAAGREGTDLAPVRGDRELMALVAYNAGHIPWPGASYWTRYVVNVALYAEALQWARQLPR